MARKDDDYIQQSLERGDRSRSEREPTRTCNDCSGRGNVTQMREDGKNAKGKPVYRSETRPCTRCGGSGRR